MAAIRTLTTPLRDLSDEALGALEDECTRRIAGAADAVNRAAEDLNDVRFEIFRRWQQKPMNPKQPKKSRWRR